MKRLEITVPNKQAEKVREVLSEYSEDVTSDEVEKEDKKFVEVRVSLNSDVIDAVTEELKEIKDLETGDLTIDILDQTAMIEKGKRREGGTTTISVQEMYSKAFEFASFGPSSWALIALASSIAVFGTIMDNVMVVIGAMVIAPMLGPFISLSFGLVVGDRRLIQDSVFDGVLSILFGVAVAFVISLLISFLLPLPVTPVMQLIADPGFATVPLSLLVGAAAALTFTTEMREALAGVAVAIALVPPAAVTGLSLAILDVPLFIDVSIVLITNIVSLVLAGSITFKLVGITPSTYYRKKVSEEQLRKALLISIFSILVLGGIVGYISYFDLQNENIRTEVDSIISEAMGDSILLEDVTVSRTTIQVRLAVVNPPTTAEDLEDLIEARTDRAVEVSLIAVEGEVQ